MTAPGPLLVVAMTADSLPTAIELAHSPEHKGEVVILTSTSDWAPLRAAAVQWEYVMDEVTWHGLQPHRPWSEYLLVRLQHVQSTWEPREIVDVCPGSLDERLLRLLCTPPQGKTGDGVGARFPPPQPAAARRDSPAADLATELRLLRRRSDDIAKDLLALRDTQHRQLLSLALLLLLDKHVPQNAACAVVSRGDPLLLVRPAARHHPALEDGRWSGEYPADDTEAVQQLQALQRDGVEYLVVPEPSRWWLDHYPRLHASLRTDGGLVVDQAGTGLIFALPPDRRGRWARRVRRVR